MDTATKSAPSDETKGTIGKTEVYFEQFLHHASEILYHHQRCGLVGEETQRILLLASAVMAGDIGVSACFPLMQDFCPSVSDNWQQAMSTTVLYIVMTSGTGKTTFCKSNSDQGFPHYIKDIDDLLTEAPSTIKVMHKKAVQAQAWSIVNALWAALITWYKLGELQVGERVPILLVHSDDQMNAIESECLGRFASNEFTGVTDPTRVSAMITNFQQALATPGFYVGSRETITHIVCRLVIINGYSDISPTTELQHKDGTTPDIWVERARLALGDEFGGLLEAPWWTLLPEKWPRIHLKLSGVETRFNGKMNELIPNFELTPHTSLVPIMPVDETPDAGEGHDVAYYEAMRMLDRVPFDPTTIDSYMGGFYRRP